MNPVILEQVLPLKMLVTRLDILYDFHLLFYSLAVIGSNYIWIWCNIDRSPRHHDCGTIEVV